MYLLDVKTFRELLNITNDIYYKLNNDIIENDFWNLYDIFINLYNNYYINSNIIVSNIEEVKEYLNI